jgi:antirestriction protein
MRNSLANRVNNYADVLDSRDIIERISELEGELQDCHDTLVSDATASVGISEIVTADLEEWLREECDGGNPDAIELKALRELQNEAEGSPDWRHGETLIRDSYFEDYARELAEDCGMLKDNESWPYTCIDWEKAARELQYDYSAVDFDGVTYWIRS